MHPTLLLLVEGKVFEDLTEAERPPKVGAMGSEL